MKFFRLFAIFSISIFLLSCSGNEDDRTASGIFEATEVMVSASASGQLLSLNFQEGERVEKGNFLAQIDTTQVYLQKLLLSTSLKAADIKSPNKQTQTAALREALRKAKIEEKRLEKMVEGMVATEKQLDDVRSQIVQLRAQLEASENTLHKSSEAVLIEKESLRIQLLQVEDLLRKSRIVSPIKGVILAKYVQAGEMIAAGRPICKIADLDEMILRAYLNGSQLNNIKMEQEVEVFLKEGNNSRAYKGKIIWIAPEAEFTPKTIQTPDERSNLVYAVKIRLVNDGYIKIGNYADIKF